MTHTFFALLSHYFKSVVKSVVCTARGIDQYIFFDLLRSTSTQAPCSQMRHCPRHHFGLRNLLQGAKLKLMKATLKFVISHMKESDQFGIITYADTVAETLKLTKMDAVGRQVPQGQCEGTAAEKNPLSLFWYTCTTWYK